jgi:hypothetical protein
MNNTPVRNDFEVLVGAAMRYHGAGTPDKPLVLGNTEFWLEGRELKASRPGLEWRGVPECLAETLRIMIAIQDTAVETAAVQ